MFVKVCGLTTREQIDRAVAYGFDAIGIVTYAKSKRYCPQARALDLAAYARGRINTVVVGKTYVDVKAVAHAFDYTQIHEPRQVPHLILALKEIPPPEIRYDYFIYDASIGSGTFKPFPEWVKAMAAKIIVAGGLNPVNVCPVIQAIRPFGVDVSSGVEKDGAKDFGLMKAFIDAVRRCGDAGALYSGRSAERPWGDDPLTCGGRMAVDIRYDCTGVDWQAVADMLARVGMTHFAPELHRKAFENSAVTVFIYQAETLIGFGRAISDGAYQAALYDVVVAPEFQRQGLGHRILEALLSRLPTCNIILYASPGKEGFYEKHGLRKMKTGMARFTNADHMQARGFTE